MSEAKTEHVLAWCEAFSLRSFVLLVYQWLCNCNMDSGPVNANCPLICGPLHDKQQSGSKPAGICTRIDKCRTCFVFGEFPGSLGPSFAVFM